jgi:hypothetical protein
MLKWHEGYYIEEGIEDPDRIRKSIDRRKPEPGIYLLTLSDNPDNLMEIVPAMLLIQKNLYRLCPQVIGMARSKDSAISLATSVIEQTYQATGNFNVKEFLNSR